MLAKRRWQPEGLGMRGGSKMSHPEGWCRGVETGSSWRCSMEGQEAAEAWGRDHPRDISTRIVISTCFSFQWFWIRALLLLSVGLHPAGDAGPCCPVTSISRGCKFPVLQPSRHVNLCILCASCQILLEVLLSRKVLFQVYSLGGLEEIFSSFTELNV